MDSMRSGDVSTLTMDFEWIENEPDSCYRLQNNSKNESKDPYAVKSLVLEIYGKIQEIRETFDPLEGWDSKDYSNGKKGDGCNKFLILNLLAKMIWPNESKNHENWTKNGKSTCDIHKSKVSGFLEVVLPKSYNVNKVDENCSSGSTC